jgi:hypothetical protein
VFDPGVIIPTIVSTLTFVLLWVVFQKLRRAFWRGAGWLVLNGYWFPKTMRAERDANVARIERNLKDLQKIIDNRSNTP